jgi:hypothetical protein
VVAAVSVPGVKDAVSRGDQEVVATFAFWWVAVAQFRGRRRRFMRSTGPGEGGDADQPEAKEQKVELEAWIAHPWRSKTSQINRFHVIENYMIFVFSEKNHPKVAIRPHVLSSQMFPPSQIFGENDRT